jgi:hypothetical protein
MSAQVGDVRLATQEKTTNKNRNTTKKTKTYQVKVGTSHTGAT